MLSIVSDCEQFGKCQILEFRLGLKIRVWGGVADSFYFLNEVQGLQIVREPIHLSLLCMCRPESRETFFS